MHYAHSLGTDDRDWELLAKHLERVAQLSSQFAHAFGASELGGLAGIWHDIGKYSVEFQEYLRLTADDPGRATERRGSVDHSTAGAQVAADRIPGRLGRLLAACLAGHHGGLPDTIACDALRGSLNKRLKKHVPLIPEAPPELLEQPKPPVPPLQLFREDGDLAAFQLAFFGRMLFSCLVDADFLATETFMDGDRASVRCKGTPSLATLSRAVKKYLSTLASDDGVVNRRRAQVLRRCLKSAAEPLGLFSLTVPTGGGKTLSSFAFALDHAARHGLRRVIYAAPFTSIIEQNADVFRAALGELGSAAVLEHHSNFDCSNQSELQLRHRLATENWDASIVVTTNVQLLESMFANRTSRCRKLHRIAKSVIILDEAQAVPVDLLRPTLAALDELRLNYGCTIVLCTATQPAMSRRDNFPIGLEDVREIMGKPNEVDDMFQAMRRVDVKHLGPLTDAALIDRLASADHQRVLCVVNTKRQAAEIFGRLRDRVGSERCYHLSTNLCAAHRQRELATIKAKLRSGPCRVVSTQLIEAGVDIDFPLVYRAIAGLDSIAQAAGRCNREGKLSGRGRVFVFEADQLPPPGHLRQTAETAIELLPDHHNDLLAPSAIDQYFDLHYWKRKHEWDKHNVMGCFAQAGVEDGGIRTQYREAAGRYRIIRDEQIPLLVPFGDGVSLIAELKSIDHTDRDFLRRAQRYTVNVRERDANDLLDNRVASLNLALDRYLILENSNAYDDRLGLRLDLAGFAPEQLYV